LGLSIVCRRLEHKKVNLFDKPFGEAHSTLKSGFAEIF